MVRESKRYSRRSVLERIGVGGLGLVGVGSASASDERPTIVSASEARAFAEAKVEAVAGRTKFSSWQGATLGEASLFHARNAGSGPTHVPSAYVFPVRNGGEDVGYVTASARSDWAPITVPRRHQLDASDRRARPPRTTESRPQDGSCITAASSTPSNSPTAGR